MGKEEEVVSLADVLTKYLHGSQLYQTTQTKERGLVGDQPQVTTQAIAFDDDDIVPKKKRWFKNKEKENTCSVKQLIGTVFDLAVSIIISFL